MRTSSNLRLSWRSLLGILIGWRAWLFLIQLLAFRSWQLSTPITHLWFYVWELWDGYWHTQIAAYGYYAPGLTLRFPLYPLLIRFLAPVFVGNFLAAALFISGFALFFAVFILYRLALRELRSREGALRSILLLLFFPTAFFLVAAYQESLFFLLSIGSFFFFRMDRMFPASMLGGLAALVRPQGVLLFPSFLVARLVKKRTWENRNAWFFLIPLALIPWCFYLYLKFGDPFLFVHDLSGWGEGPWQRARTISFPITVLFSYVKEFFIVGGQILSSGFALTPLFLVRVKEVGDFLFFLTFVFLGIWVAKWLDLSYTIYYFSSLLLMLSVGTLKGAPRFVLVLFPGFLVLSKLLKNPRVFGIFLWGSSIILIAFLLLFSLGYWVA